MQSSKSKRHNQIETRQFRVVVTSGVELIYADREIALYSFLALSREGGRFEVYLERDMFKKRRELFFAGHRLVLVAEADNLSPILFLTDAWFDRDCA